MFSSEYSTHIVLWLCAVLSLAGSMGSVFLCQFSPLQSCASEVPSCRAETAPLPYGSSMCLTTDVSRKKLKRNCRIKLGLRIPLAVFWKAMGWNRTSLWWQLFLIAPTLTSSASNYGLLSLLPQAQGYEDFLLVLVWGSFTRLLGFSYLYPIFMK